MLIRELSRDQCTEILQRRNLGRLGCSLDSQPYIVPIHFSFDAERRCVYGFSTIGQKVTWMRTNPLVCLQVDEIEDKDNWTSVIVYGRYEEIHAGGDDEAEARRRAQELFRHRREWWLPAAARLPDREPHAMVLYRITIDRLTGRAASRRPTGG